MEMNHYRQIMKGREELITALNNSTHHQAWSHMTGINIIYEDSTHISSTTVCHAGLDRSYEHDDKGEGAIAVVSGLMKPRGGRLLEEEEALIFLDWLLNESPYSSTFITKSAQEALHYKTIISSAFHPSNLMAAGLVASRRLWEWEQVVRVFVDLVKAGVNKDLAFYLGHIFSGNFSREGNCNWSADTHGHCSMFPSKLDLYNYLNHKVVYPNANYSENTAYSGYDEMYGDNHIGSWVHGNFPYDGKKEVKAAFPFPKDVGKGKAAQTDYKGLIEGMVDFQHSIFKHIGYNQEKKAA